MEEMKRLSREGQGREDGVGRRRAATVRAAASSRRKTARLPPLMLLPKSVLDAGRSKIKPPAHSVSENFTTLKPEAKSDELSSLGTAATAISGSVGVVALILLLVGLLSMTLKKWRHERLFQKQLRHQTDFLHKTSELSCHADAIYSNMINLDPWKEDDFAVYGNVPPFNRPRKTSPDRVEYASIVFR